jgi:hypothetical protein
VASSALLDLESREAEGVRQPLSWVIAVAREPGVAGRKEGGREGRGEARPREATDGRAGGRGTEGQESYVHSRARARGGPGDRCRGRASGDGTRGGRGDRVRSALPRARWDWGCVSIMEAGRVEAGRGRRGAWRRGGAGGGRTAN